MKFICHNCGFSAEIPKAITVCPMCGSTNTAAETVIEETRPEPISSPHPEKESATPPASTPTPSEDLRIKTASLSEEFFTKKPYQEEQEIADLLKEISSEELRKPTKRFPVKKTLGVTGIIIAGIGVTLWAIFSTTENPPVRSPAIPKPQPETGSTENPAGTGAEPAPAARPEPEPAPAAKPEPEPAPAAKPEPEPAPAARPEPEPAPAAKPAPVAKPSPKPAPRLKPTPAPKPVPTPQATNGSFEKLLAEGNRAIAEQRFTDAIHAYKDALTINPRSGKVHKFLGIAYASQGNAAKACEHYRKYLAMVPDAPDRSQVEQLTADCP